MKISIHHLTANARVGRVSCTILGDTPEGKAIDIPDADLMVAKSGGYGPISPKIKGYVMFTKKVWNDHKDLFKAAFDGYLKDRRSKDVAFSVQQYYGPDPKDAQAAAEALHPASWEDYAARMDEMFADIQTTFPILISKTQQKIDNLQRELEFLRDLLYRDQNGNG